MVVTSADTSLKVYVITTDRPGPLSCTCFSILDHAITSFQLKIKICDIIYWEMPTLNQQSKECKFKIIFLTSSRVVIHFILLSCYYFLLILCCRTTHAVYVTFNRAHNLTLDDKMLNFAISEVLRIFIHDRHWEMRDDTSQLEIWGFDISSRLPKVLHWAGSNLISTKLMWLTGPMTTVQISYLLMSTTSLLAVLDTLRWKL